MAMGSKGKNSKKVVNMANAKDKSFSFKRLVASWTNSFAGLKFAYLHEQSLTIHIILTAIVVFCGFYFKITPMHWALMLFVMALIIVTELINTAIEATVDLVTDKWHPLAKIAKDCASAAVFVVCIMSACMWAYVFLPKIIKILF